MNQSRILAVRYLNRTSQSLCPKFVKPLSTNASLGDGTDHEENSNKFESGDDFERRIFGGFREVDPKKDVFFQRLDKVERAHDKFSGDYSDENESYMLDGLDESFTTLSDGMDGKLKESANYFEFDEEEVLKDDYCFRPEINEKWRTYDIQDLDPNRVAVPKVIDDSGFYVTTKEALMKADFRNVRFLANFLTEAGIIDKRIQTKISAKAQRKVAREIKTARAFGLMPFTTMGTKSFVFGKTMQNLDEDFEYETYDGHLNGDVDEIDPF